MLADRLSPDVAVFVSPYNFCLAVAFPFLCYLQVNDITRHTEWRKYNHVVYSCQAFAFGCNIRHGYVLKYGERFLS